MIDSGAHAAPHDTLLHVADLHFWHVTWNPFRMLNKRVLGNANVFLRRRHQYAMERADHFVNALHAVGPRQLLFTGDFSSTSLDEEFKRARAFVDAVAGRGFAIQILPGNHDLYTFESLRQRRFEHYFAPYMPGDGYPAQHTLPGGTPLILVQTACPNLVSSRGRVTPHQLEWVEGLIDEVPDPVIVAGHYPLLTSTTAYEMSYERRLRGAEPLRQLLGRSGKRILYVAGHVHRFSYVVDPEFPNLRHLCTGTFFGHNKRENLDGEFSEIHVGPDGFDVYRHTYDTTWHKLPAPCDLNHANSGANMVASPHA